MHMDLKDKTHEQTEKNKSFIQSADFAITGWKTAFHDERNFRSHIATTGLAIVAGFIFKLAMYEWFWLLGSCFLVLFAELVNTAFENVVDMVTDQHFHPIGKKVKDIAAGAVLLTACFAFLIGCLIFIPKIVEWFN